MDAGRLPLPYQGGLDYQTALRKREKGGKKKLSSTQMLCICVHAILKSQRAFLIGNLVVLYTFYNDFLLKKQRHKNFLASCPCFFSTYTEKTCTSFVLQKYLMLHTLLRGQS